MDLLSRQVLNASAGSVIDTAWDLSYVSFTGTPQNWFRVAAQDGNPYGLFFKPDGTKMYHVGLSSDKVSEYDLTTPWDIGSASYVQGFSYLAQSTNVTGIFFKADGTKLYMTDTFYDSILEYDLSTGWDVSTASYVQGFSISAQDGGPSSLFFKDDGTKMYMIGLVNDAIYEYNLSAAWDISTASYSQSFSVATQDTQPRGLFFKPDGTKVYVIGTSARYVNEYNLSTAWDVSTASYLQRFYVGTQEITCVNLFFKPDGTQMYMIGQSYDSVWKYNLSSAWDISTASFIFPATNYLDVSAQDPNPYNVFFKPDGTKMYMLGGLGTDVNEYDLSTAWEISSASYLQSFSVSVQESTPLGIFFKPDGTKMYIIGSYSDSVHEYDVSAAWDISTASYSQSFSVAAQETNPNGVFFRPTGDVMYVVGTSGDDINQYGLSSAWDVSTASFVRNFYVGSNPVDVFFKPDGTKMYVLSNGGRDIDEYELSTAWNISTASYLQNFSVLPVVKIPQGIFFKDDGKKVYVTGNGSDAIWSFDF